MHLVSLSVSILTFLVTNLGQVLEPSPFYSYIYFPYENQTIGAGTLCTIEWDSVVTVLTAAVELIEPATLYLLGGNDPATLRVLPTLASVDVNDAEYKWAVNCSLGQEKTCLIKIASDLDNGNTFGISPPFHIEGPNVCHSNFSQIRSGPSNYPPKPTSYPCKPTA
ncbi:hypothetical protein F4859DRAFT_512073 [Xylaria cf. heliscus]|nr:hypothetical protein F4859DRAFT_512073 [Xylaria cf. heliscus]